MRVASFNVESFFSRAKALNLATWAEGRPILEAYAELNALLNKPLSTLNRAFPDLEQCTIVGCCVASL